MSLGFQNAGLEVFAAFDHWTPAVNVYRTNFDHPVYETDLLEAAKKPSTFSHYSPDVIIGGPP